MGFIKKLERNFTAAFAGAAILCSGAVYGFEKDGKGDAPIIPDLIIFEHPEEERCLDENVEKKESSQAQHEKKMEPVPSIKEYVLKTPQDLFEGTKRVFSKDNISLAAAGFGLTGLAVTIDNKVKKYFQDERPLKDVPDAGDILGNVFIHAGAAAGLFFTGELFDDKKLADTGVATGEALLINAAATYGIKHAVGRERPDKSDRQSFPSFHASGTAALAASISEMYDWDPGIAAPLYLTAAFVSASRLEDNKHYLSDVVAGMTLGTIIGRSAAKSHKEKGNKQQVLITPLYEKDAKGLILSLKF